MTFCTIRNRKCILFFGGYSAECMRVVSDLIIVDIASSIWWFATIAEGSVAHRMDSVISFMDSKLFVFGGRQAFDDESILNSYSIAEYSDKGWRWGRVDEERECPQLGYGSVAVTFPERNEIMLISGRKKFASPFHINKKNMFVFDVGTYTFRPNSLKGPVPGQLWWYAAYQLRAPGTLQRSASPSPSSREESPLTDLSSPPPSPPPSNPNLPLLVGGWTSRNPNETIPELWECNLEKPSEGMRCLHVREKLAELKLDVQVFIACGRRVFILGYKHPKDHKLGPKYDYPPADAKWNVSVEIVFA
ncbi:hypothetical protein BDN72DRAFT_839893 [Pluteus cervinus]|uniref:Uncharacterized protein n=1 Tax=Pluteus cervinus TaxID=181527 RepID=A0ACD3AWA9_9AGAR|nr:hypothetical protein BDN72DRAFT_839893 [Pluteus cervinus]